MRLGCCTWNFMTEFPSPPEKAIAAIAGLGFAGFELIVFSKTELLERYPAQEVDRLRRYYQAFGLTLSEFAIDLGALKGLARYEIEERQTALETFDLGASVGRDLGCDLINFVPHWPAGMTAPHQFLPFYIHPSMPGARGNAGPTWRLELPEGFEWEAVWDHYIDSLAMCVNIAQKKGLRIALEGHPHSILSNSDSFLRLFDQLPSQTLGVNFDTAMLAAIHREYPPLSIHKLGSRIFHVHARDTDGSLNYSLPAGRGILDWLAILEALQQVGFDGFISIELGENCRQPEEYAAQSRRYLQSLLEKSNPLSQE